MRSEETERLLTERRQRAVAYFALACAALAALLLAAPGQTVSARYLNDLFVFLDGAHRVLAGHVPHRDFHTPIGPVTNLIPAVGFLLTGSWGAAMPVGMALVILLLAPVLAHVLSSRLRPVLAIPFAVYLTLILAAPANLGEEPQVLSFAMFYNRIGWAAFALLLLMYLPPRHGARWLLDGACAAVLTSLMLYTKATYGVVALAFLCFMLLDRRQWRWPALALAATLWVTLVLEALWRLPSGYAADLLQAARASGAVQGGIERLIAGVWVNLLDYALFALAAAIALYRVPRLQHLVFFAACAAAGLLIYNQNFQPPGIVALAAAAVVATEIVARSLATGDGVRRPLALASVGFVFAMVGPTLVGRAVALATHLALATGPAQALPLDRLDRIVLADTGTKFDVEYTASYLATIADGARALAALGVPPSRVAVLDFANPFSVGLGLAPARGDYTVSQLGRTFDEKHFLPPETVLGDAAVVMHPIGWRIDAATADGFLELYRSYLAANFELARETTFWKIYLRRQPGAAPGATAAGPTGTRQ